jgi:3-oxoacyl-[acyl-carrier protein] reductase
LETKRMAEKRLAVVTGAARGIGRAIVFELLRQGRVVAGLDIKEDQLKELEQAAKEAGFEVLTRCVDITQTDKLTEVLDALASEFGGIGILVNNAGITRDNLLLRMSETEWDAVIRINLTGTFNMTKAVTKHMFKKRYGRVVNIASVIGQMGNAGQSNYAASKAGIIGFTKSVAKEFAPRGVTANAIAPGFIDTPMTAVLPEDVQEQMRRMIPLGRFGTGNDVANVVLFLVSELGTYVTGQVINCDGGMVMAR